MPPKLLLVNPAADFPTYFGAESFAAAGRPPTTFVADLATVSVAAFAARHFDVRIADEHLAPIDIAGAPETVGITGKINQWGRMKALAAAFRESGRTVVIGGPFASLSPDTVRPHCDVLVRGELEDIADQVFGDLAAGTADDEYVGDRPELGGAPLPRWDLYPNARALLGVVQTARGCPFECEFCDVIQYLGRKQRHKPIADVLAELDVLYADGYRDVFIADDNFTAYRARCRELLDALAAWNRQHDGDRLGFSTQVSIDAARDEDLLARCAAAGIYNVFIGIETPNVESLRESKKRQNLRVDLNEQVDRFLAHGISVIGGLIVGFDNDGPEIFDLQRDFVGDGAIPLVTLGALVAPEATPLHDRLSKAGRLVDDLQGEVAGVPWATNIIPTRMTRDELMHGLGRLTNDLYHPDAFRERMLRFVARLDARKTALRSVGPGGRPRQTYLDALSMLKKLSQRGDAEERLCTEVYRAAAASPGAATHVAGMLLRYAQARYMFDRGQFWEQHAA